MLKRFFSGGKAMSKKDVIFSLMLGFLIASTRLMLMISILNSNIIVGMGTVLNAVALVLFAVWIKLKE